MNKQNKMGTMPMNQLFWKMGIPTIISMVLQALYNVIDSIFVVNMGESGTIANQALTYSFPIQIIIIAIGVGTGVGLNTLLSKSLGENNHEKVNEIAKIEDAEEFIIETIRQVMVEVVDESIGENDREASVIAKTGLISEAAKYLAEELGRVATARELADYTKLSEQEIESVLKLSLDAVELGKGDL